MHGNVPSVGFPAIAVITVSDFMMVAELRLSSQALICSSTMLGLASINILTFIGRGISLTPSVYQRQQTALYWIMISGMSALRPKADIVHRFERPFLGSAKCQYSSAAHNVVCGTFQG
jgi:hypothetical protein